MRLLLIRHAETVDNVAGIYAGSRDSPLTAHGALQARRLGAHLASRSAAAAAGSSNSGSCIGLVRYIFSSDLTRAVETARAILLAQAQAANAPENDADADADGGPAPALVQRPELRERDFGAAEGKRFGDVRGWGDDDLVLVQGAESREEMRGRAERFALQWLVPALRGSSRRGCVVVVAHGLILDALLKMLLARFGRAGEIARLQRLGRTVWSNTGYAELSVEPSPVVVSVVDEVVASCSVATGKRSPQQQLDEQRIILSLVGVNVLKHLEGLKKTRGGIGSARFDKRQRTMDSFFGPAAKRARVDRGSEEA